MKSWLSLAAAAALLALLLLPSSQAQDQGKAAPPLCDPTHLTSPPLAPAPFPLCLLHIYPE